MRKGDGGHRSDHRGDEEPAEIDLRSDWGVGVAGGFWRGGEPGNGTSWGRFAEGDEVLGPRMVRGGRAQPVLGEGEWFGQ